MSFAASALAQAEAVARNRAPDGRRLARFRWAWTGRVGWLIPRTRGAGGAAVSADFRVASEGMGAVFAYHIAHAVRQDLWRALAGLRGFWPVVQVAPSGSFIDITAGGFLAGRVPEGLAEHVAALPTPERLRLWTGWAGAKTPRTGD